MAVAAATLVLMAGCASVEPTVATAPASPSAASTPVRTAAPTTPAPTTAASSAPIPLGELSGRIAFAFDDGVWVSDADGSDRHRLTNDGGFDPTFSPDGTRIAYRLLLAADDGEIWVMGADGSDPHDLVNDPDFSDWGPAWSPDGRQIAYDSNRTVGLAIWVMDADGIAQHLISSGHGEYPSWSPDGMRIAYAGGDNYDIHVADSDGSNDIALTATPAYDMGPA